MALKSKKIHLTKAPAVWIETGLPRRWFVAELVVFVLWLCMIGAALWVEPDPRGYGTHEKFWLAPCQYKLLLNNPCPTCGLTTCFSALLHGEFGLAMKAHPLGLGLFLWMAIGAVYYGSKFALGYRIHANTRLVLAVNLLLLGIFLGFGFWRMLS